MVRCIDIMREGAGLTVVPRCPRAADEGLLDAGDVCERILDGRLRPVAEKEQVRERADQRTVPGAQQARPPNPAVGEDVGLDEALHLRVQIARVAARLACEVGDARLPVRLQQHRRQETRLRIAPQHRR
jgi:hypothetical protein